MTRVFATLVKGVRVDVTSVAQVKVMTDNLEYLSAACEQFLGRSEWDIKKLILATLEGHLRAIIGTMEVEELFQDRESFAHNGGFQTLFWENAKCLYFEKFV